MPDPFYLLDPFYRLRRVRRARPPRPRRAVEDGSGTTSTSTVAELIVNPTEGPRIEPFIPTPSVRKSLKSGKMSESVKVSLVKFKSKFAPVSSNNPVVKAS